jgi:hypothetical protein
MNRRFELILFLSLFIIVSCNRDKEISRLLKSSNPNERIEGAYEAGKSGNMKYVPLLLNDANDPSASTLLHFKGFTVYTETMFALERILHVKPPHPYKDILLLPDSVNVKFYTLLWQKMNKGN